MSELDIEHANYLIEGDSCSQMVPYPCNSTDVLFCPGSGPWPYKISEGRFEEYGTQNGKIRWRDPHIYRGDYYTISWYTWGPFSGYFLSHPLMGYWSYTPDDDPLGKVGIWEKVYIDENDNSTRFEPCEECSLTRFDCHNINA